MPQVSRIAIHFYNLEGRHFFSSFLFTPSYEPLIDRVERAVAANISGGALTSRTLIDLDFGTAGCFAWGPLAGVFVINEDIAHPSVGAFNVMTIWQQTRDGLPAPEAIDFTSAPQVQA